MVEMGTGSVFLFFFFLIFFVLFYSLSFSLGFDLCGVGNFLLILVLECWCLGQFCC